MSTAEFVIAEISDFNENVCYEMGQCVALEKWCYRIKNKLYKPQELPDGKIIPMLDSLKYEQYSVDPALVVLAGLSLQSATKVVTEIAIKFRKLRKEQRKAVNPFDNTNRLSLIQSHSTPTIFIYAEKSQDMAMWIKDYGRMIRDEVGVLFLDDPGTTYKGPETLKYLELIARSTHCIIDISCKNRFSSYLLGYAVGRDRHHLAVARRGTDSVITNYRGYAAIEEYEFKDELWQIIRRFVQNAR